jgi:hypothetical protein
MAFRSLSAVINTKIVQAQNAAMASVKLSSATMNNMGAIRANEQILAEEQNVLTWGNSTWGVEKVTSFYKPKN